MMYKQIEEDVTNAMKARDSLKLNVLRSVKTNIKNYLISEGKEELTDEEVVKIIRKMIKQREDSIEHYKKAGDKEREKVESDEINILNSYVPKMLDEEETYIVVKEVIESMGEVDVKQKGVIIKKVMEKTDGNASGKIINQMIDKVIKG